MNKFKWVVSGDIDGFFGLFVDNLIQLLVLIALLSGLCGFPMHFIYKSILPGIGISLLIGNLFYSYQSYKLSLKESREDVTALPYGVNTVSLFAFIFFIIFPIYKSTGDYQMAWKVGLAASFLSGLIELGGAFIAEKIRRVTPRAALLSTLAGIAMTFISMDFILKTFQNPLVAFLPFGIILLQYFGKVVFPFRIPGGLVSVLAGTALAWLSGFWGKPMMDISNLSKSVDHFGFFLPVFSIREIFSIFGSENLGLYASIIIPMGIFNVIGSLQNIESAEAVGDKYNTRDSLAVNGIGTIIGSFVGSPFPTTIYIGHPGWKALGARSGYSVLNGTFMTIVCLFGLMGVLQALIPIEAGMAIVLWIGIIIGSQAFESSPSHHSPAAVVGLLPSLAGWGVLLVTGVFSLLNGNLETSMQETGIMILPFSMNGLISLSQGFLLTSMIWASVCVFIIEKDFLKAFYWSLAAGVFASIGVIHSYSLKGNAVLNNFTFPAFTEFSIAYAILALLFLLSFIFYNRKK